MKSAAAILIMFLLMGSDPAIAQDWINDLFKEGLSNPNDIVASLRVEMQKAIGSNAPSFAYRLLKTGELDSLSNHIGKTLIVTLWHTNCSGCRMQLPELSRLQESYRDRGVAVFYISPEEATVLTTFFKEHTIIGYKAIMSPKKLTRPFQLLATPSAFIVDKEGVIREVWIGPESFDTIEKRVLPYVASNE